MMWMIGAFVFCPCHLPITLSALALLLGGTAAGALLRAHPYVAGAVVTLLWAAGTWRGFALVKRARTLALTRTSVRRTLLAYFVWRSTGSSRSTGVGLPSRSSVTR